MYCLILLINPYFNLRLIQCCLRT